MLSYEGFVFIFLWCPLRCLHTLNVTTSKMPQICRCIRDTEIYNDVFFFPFLSVKASKGTSLFRKNSLLSPLSSSSRNLLSGSFSPDESLVPLTNDYLYVIVFHPDYEDLVEVDGFDIDYGGTAVTFLGRDVIPRLGM
ncbi:hypothetical protein VNO80_03353 [Phaseolus coccineus]|uniref:Uncharacterized protein n=1 Tax=Phaseolus coccineus TaxID=3886 RepID=A0AAN9NYI6_PHACN